MEGPKTELEDDFFSLWKGLRQRKRKQIIPNGRAKDNERGRCFPCGRATERERGSKLFQMEGPKTEKEDDFSIWKGQRQ